MGEFRDWLVKKDLNEKLKEIFYYKEKLTWNINKTDKEWKDRIKERTGLSESSFCDLLQHGIDLKKSEFCKSGQTCLMFQKSQFIVIIDIPKLCLITIRDSSWDKIINNSKPCKRVMIFESKNDIIDIIENVNFNEVDFSGYSYYMTGEPLILEVLHKCNCCITVDL